MAPLVRRRRAISAVFLAVSVLVIPSGALGSPGPKPAGSTARRLAQLEAQVSATRHEVQRLNTQLVRLAGRVSAEESDYRDAITTVAIQRSRLMAAQQAYQEAKSALDERVREVYMQGPGASLEAVLGATSLGDLGLVLETQDRQVASDSELAASTAALDRTAAAMESGVSKVLDQQARLLADLDYRRHDLAAAFTQEQGLLDELVASRQQLQQLARASRLATGAGTGGMTITFAQWADLFLQRLGVPDCTSNQIAVVAWETAEYTDARWNPLATTYPMPGATRFNEAGVKNYLSRDQGRQASVSTVLLGVRDHGYGGIIAALGTCAEPLTTAEAIRASDWCHGCAGGNYVTDIVPAVQASYGRRG